MTDITAAAVTVYCIISDFSGGSGNSASAVTVCRIFAICGCSADISAAAVTKNRRLRCGVQRKRNRKDQ
jgi:hypothetical protein